MVEVAGARKLYNDANQDPKVLVSKAIPETHPEGVSKHFKLIKDHYPDSMNGETEAKCNRDLDLQHPVMGELIKLP